MLQGKESACSAREAFLFFVSQRLQNLCSAWEGGRIREEAVPRVSQ